ncbi:hypothetical protein F4X73_06670 [Candidatus Poribacteria bacterium]|nr:hypothetical protein [Candidatus Poribacteria bacterium]MYB64355.1 hypothetical protein [Candidatus Poribacteria bacterium]
MQENTPHQVYQTIIDKLNAVRRNWRWLIFSERLLKLLSILAITLTAVLLIFQLPLNPILHSLLLVVCIGFGIYITLRVLIIPLTRKLTYAKVAAFLETFYPSIENRILSSIQLRPTLDDNRLGYAPEFIEQLILQTQNDIDQIKSARIFQTELRKIRMNSLFAIFGFALLILANFLLPSSLNGFTRTIESIPIKPSDGFAARIENVSPGNIQIKRGEDITLTAKVSGHLDAPVAIYYQLTEIGETESSEDNEIKGNVVDEDTQLPHDADPDRWQSIQMSRNANQALYSATIEQIDRSMQYYVSTKDVTSTHFQITVSEEPIVKTFQLELTYPPYTQLPSQQLDTNVGDVEVLYGTEITFTGVSNKPLSEAHLIFQDSDPVNINIDFSTLGEKNMKGSFIAEQASTYHIHIQDEHGMSNKVPLTYTLNVFKDEAPQVDIIEPGKDLVLDTDLIVRLKVDATDDYGLQNVQLVYRIQKDDFNPIKTTLKHVPHNTSPPLTTQFLTYAWDIAPIGLFPGETLSYYVQATDTDDVSGPNIGKSRTFTLRFPTLDELYEDIAAEQETEQQSLDELYDEQAEATSAVENILEKIRKFKDLSLTDKKLLKQVVESQQQIEEKANDLIDSMQQTTTDMEKNELFEPETIQKYQELQELMKEALTEEQREILKKLGEALAKQELSQQESDLTQANFNQEQFQQQLERLKSLYEQLILQQKLEAAAKQAQQLAEQQKTLMDSLDTAVSENTEDTQDSEGSDERTKDTSETGLSDKSKMNDAAQKEDMIKKETDKLSDKLESIGDELADTAKSQENTAPQIQKVADEVKRLNQYTKDQQLPDNLQSTSQSLRNENRQQALETGREAEQTMTELAQGLDNALEFMEGSNNEQALAAMNEAVKSSLYYSHLHEKVIEQTEGLTISSLEEYVPSEIKRLQELAAKELSASQGISQIAENLWELGKQQMEVDPKIVWRLNASSDALGRAARALEDREASLALPIQRTGLADINQAISDMLDAMAQMNQQMGAGGLQSMLEQLQQLAQSQEQLNEMAERLSQQMREQGRTPSLQQRLERIASQQQLIREATERLSKIADEASEILGSLQNVAEEMEDVETKLKQGTLDKDVVDQQKRILTRMLDSLKSLEKRDVGRRRKAQVAKRPSTPAQDVPPLHPDLLEYVRKLDIAPNAKEFENIPYQYREQLRQYFKALSEKTVDE